MFVYAVTGWRPFFPIIPRRTISGRLYWFKKIYRRKILFVGYMLVEPDYQYADTFDMIRYHE